MENNKKNVDTGVNGMIITDKKEQSNNIVLVDNNIEEALNGGKNSDRRNLVFCETFFQLFSTLTIFLKFKNHAPVDIVLTDDSNFFNAKSVLEKTDIFDNIYTFEIHDSIFDLWQKIKPEERENIALDPGSYINDIELEHTYTDLWVNLDTMAPKMFYYKLKNLGMSPVVHFVDEGTSSYILDFSATKKDFINHKRLFGELAFSQRLGDMWLNEPRIYSGEYKDIPLYKIPNEILQDEEIIELYRKIFGEGELPKEKYIFFEESFAAEGRTTNDLELFREIVSVVGKDNIIVKRHPRNPIDRFSALGYKVMGMQSVPWEMMILGKDISDKVLISVGSSATLTPFYLYGMKPKAFLLKKLLIGHVHYLDNPKMNTFFYSVVKLINESSTNVYYPVSHKELKLALEYIVNNRDNDDEYVSSVEADCEAEDSIEESRDFTLIDFSVIDDTEKSKKNAKKSDGIEEDEYNALSLEERERVIEEAKLNISGPYVSVVVPVYGTEKYLRRCLDSLVFQTLENIEILVVNDGSPDNSQDIIDEYAERFPDKIIPLIKENGGLSSAREFGAKHATGKYIGFIDSDDWVDYHYCEHCFNALVLENTKVVVFAVKHVYESGYVGKGVLPKDNSIPSIIMDAAASFWSKVYEREFFLENVQFLHMWYEDIPVINPMISYLDKVSLLKEHLYYYVRERSDSITNSKLDTRQLDYAKAEKTAIESTNPKYRKYQLARSISRILGNKNRAFYDHSISFIKDYADELQDEEVQNLFSDYQRKQLNLIINSSFEILIPNIIYLNGFIHKNVEDRERISKYYLGNAFWNESEVVWLDETNCDINSNIKLKSLFENEDFDELSKICAITKIYETGGVYLNNVLFSSTLNQLRFNRAFFGFKDVEHFLFDIFGAEKESVVLKKILDIFSINEMSIEEAAYAVLIGFVGFTLNGKTQDRMNGILLYSPNVFAYRIDASNICSVISLSEDKSTVMLETGMYESMLSYFKFIDSSKNTIIKSERKRVENRDRKIKKLENKNAKNEKKLLLYNRMSKSVVFKAYRKLFKLFHK